MMKRIGIRLLLVIIMVASCKQVKKESSTDIDTDVKELFELMQGSFNSEKQSLADSTYYNISLHMYPIWKEKGNWLYVEQAMNSMQDKPYRQRVYEVKRNEKGQLASYVYTLPNDSLWIAKWKTPKAFDNLSKENLELRKGCEVLLTKKSDSAFVGKTRDGTCESTLRGASYAMSKVEITSKGITSWDQGFDSEGQQVWGATEGGYVFDKINN
ncbi:MAG: chromophore lyase CpcT/CpeT [Bacteroidota bacterium]